VNASSLVGRKWIVSYDEQAPATDGVVPDTDDPTHDNIRKNVLWANLMVCFFLLIIEKSRLLNSLYIFPFSL
jgi:hypothetical protein